MATSDYRDKLVETVENAVKNKTVIRIVAQSPEDDTYYTFIFTPIALERGYARGVNIDGKYVEVHWDFWTSVEIFPMGL